MKITPFNKQNFQELSQLDRVEFLLRKEIVKNNIKKSMPIFEILSIVFIFACSRLFNVILLGVIGTGQDAIQVIGLLNLFVNTLIAIFMISFITRIIRYFQKHRQLSELHDEFLERLQVKATISDIGKEIAKDDKTLNKIVKRIR